MTSVAFVPSPDLMNSYQSSFSKTICGEPVNTPNLKLKSIFSSAIPKKNLNEDKRAINFNIDKGTFDYVGNALEGKCI